MKVSSPSPLLEFFTPSVTCTDFQSVTSLSVGDGRMGYAEEAPYDAIHVGAAAPVVPQAVSWAFFWYLCALFLKCNIFM